MASKLTTNLTSGVKDRITDLKAHLKLKNESLVIGYLCALYDAKYDKLTVKEHELCLDQSEEMNNQAVFKGR
jgi:uncharacterized protein YbbC (DUF1343 family)